MSVAENLALIHDRIAAACSAAGREVDEVRLLPVSKTHGPDKIAEAYAAGERLFGENRVQEAADKAEQFADRPEVRWAIIGHLQTNKAKVVAGFASEFHALDSPKLAQTLDRRLHDLGRTLDVFIQVNSSAEPQKFGLPPEEVEAFAEELAGLGALRVRGLMTLAVFSDDETAVRGCFERMQTLRARLVERGVPGSYDELSMGMSGDFELAIRHGATTVRVGQAIFGARLRPQDYWG